jgi:LPS-assembly protein
MNKIRISLAILCSAAPIGILLAQDTPDSPATQLGWHADSQYQCGGYYLEPSYVYPVINKKDNTVQITGDQGLYSQYGTSTLEGKVSVTRFGQQITARKGILYRDPVTAKLTMIDMIGDVHLREPNTLVIGKSGRYHFDTGAKSLLDIIYRTALNGRQIVGPKIRPGELESERKVTQMTAWGNASEFSQTEAMRYELTGASFSTCPPISPAWRVKASYIYLNKESGRGYATNARILVKGIPVFYTPYINFPLDSRRKTGFLWPTLGVNNSYGPYALLPFYWNMAPEYDMTLTLGALTKRGAQLNDNFRYLTDVGAGNFNVTVLPTDTFFQYQKVAYREKFGGNSSPTVQAELNRLLNSSTTRRSLQWRDKSNFNEHWSTHVDFNYAGDDYYLQDFGNNLSDITQNNLLQEADLNYKGINWNFTGRVQTYQTMHPLLITGTTAQNQYRRFPQLILNGDYPDQPLGLDYFIENDATHFDIRNTPGTTANQPIGNRLHTQPGISLPLVWPYFYINPRAQFALTYYDLYQTTPTNTPNIKHRAVPIIDVASGISLNRDSSLFNTIYHQTLEPQVYYTYIPVRNQSSIPVFDTTVSTLTYDQIFTYNRFSGLDRIGDANQLGVGVTTRLIDSESGIEKVRMGVGELMYFANRRVTLCNNTTCTDNPFNPDNHRKLSPLSGVLDYHISQLWQFTANGIWNPITKQLDNSTLQLHFQPSELQIINIGYNFARNGDIQSGITENSSQNNLKNTDLSFSWPIIHDVSVLGRWSQAWNTNHLQNLLYGLQYDTCCWAVRLVGGRAFIGPNPDNKNTLQYNNQFYIQFSLKGLGDIGSGNPEKILSSISGYNTHFGQEF